MFLKELQLSIEELLNVRGGVGGDNDPPPPPPPPPREDN